MRIGLSTSVIQHGKTGIAQYVLSLVRSFLEEDRGHEFTLFVLEKDLELFEFARYSMQIVVVPERFRPPLRDIWWHQKVLPVLARQLGLDLLHVPSYRRMIWRRPCSLVATIHDLAPFHIPRKYDWRRMFYARNCVRRLIRRQDEVIAISQTTAQDINRFFGMPLPRINVIYNGLDHARFFPGNRRAARDFIADRYRLDRPYFIYVSRLEHPAKNHVRLIASFNEFKATVKSPWQLVFAGGNWHGADAIHSAVAQSPFASEIHALGFVPNEDVPLLYRAAGGCVYPSLYEGFGLPILEAMASGCPVISSNRGSLKEVVAEAGLQLDPEDLKAWTAAMARMACDPVLDEQFRTAGLQRARQFDWRQTAAATLKIYERGLPRVRSPRAGLRSVPRESPELLGTESRLRP